MLSHQCGIVHNQQTDFFCPLHEHTFLRKYFFELLETPPIAPPDAPGVRIFLSSSDAAARTQAGVGRNEEMDKVFMAGLR